jgi:hypothetical protein
MIEVDIKSLKKQWFNDEEIESIKKWLKDIKNWKVVDYAVVKKISREKIFSKQADYA